MIHVLRVPVEIILFQLYKDGQVPQIMTFQGWNLDIITGITAVPFLLILLLKRSLPEKAFRLWNIFGIILLGIIVTTAILSAPSPLQILAYEHPNLAILNFPYTLLPATVVPIALLSHLLLLRDHHKITD